MFTFTYITDDSGTPQSILGQCIFILTIILNLYITPKIMKKCDKKMKEILNPMINSSYSKVSIQIIHALKFNSYIVISFNIIHLVAIIYYQIATQSHGRAVRNFLYAMYQVQGIICQFILFMQFYEWSIVIHSILYQNGRSILQLIKIFQDKR